MGRLGITYTQVVEKAEAILALSELPTIEKIRRALGDTGNNTIIGRHLREWKAERLGEASAEKGGKALPDPLQKLVQQLWDALRSECHAESRTTIRRIKAEITTSASRTRNSGTREK